MSEDDIAWHKRYVLLGSADKELVDDSMREVVERLRQYGRPTAFDDRAEALVAAITRYMIESTK